MISLRKSSDPVSPAEHAEFFIIMTIEFPVNVRHEFDLIWRKATLAGLVAPFTKPKR